MIEKKDELIIHVGMPKCASTYLQKIIFPKIIGVRTISHYSNDFWKYFSEFVSPNYVTFPKEKAKKEIEAFLLKTKQKKVLISYEGFFGSYHNNYQLNYTNACLLKEMLEPFFKKIKVLLIIRNQLKVIESNYKQLVAEGYGGTFSNYLNYYAKSFHFKKPSLNINLDYRNLNYLPYIKNYHNLFNIDNVLVLPYEVLLTNPTKFFHQLGSFILNNPNAIKETSSSKLNKSKSSDMIKINRWLNKIFITRHSNGSGILQNQPNIKTLEIRKNENPFMNFRYKISKKITRNSFLKLIEPLTNDNGFTIPIEIEETLSSYFIGCNKELQKELNFNLKKLNYPI